jgi:cytochrome oxidase Cu insertion factor (SCO1/SenC/PrrC family)
MAWRHLIITILIIAPFLWPLAYGFTRDSRYRYIKSPLLAKPASPFTVTLFDGRKLTLNDLRGKAVILNFWASWCPPCRAEARDLEAAWQKVQDKKHDPSRRRAARHGKELGCLSRGIRHHVPQRHRGVWKNGL